MNVAFLQNQWFKNPEQVEMILRRAKENGLYERTRTKLLTYSLFAGCLTGRRIKKAFGENIVSQLRWENVSPRFGGSSSCCFEPDYEHVKKVLEKEKPEIVLTFGNLAKETLKKFEIKNLVCGPHPAARFKDIKKRLEEMAKTYYVLINKKKK